jgi:hypothetical protein
MTVSADECFPRFSESFQMNLMTNPVPRSGKIEAMFPGNTLKILMIVCILKSDLDGVMIDITDGQLGFDPGDVHGLKLKISHGSGGVLRQCLINPDADLSTGYASAGNPVRCDDFFRNRFAHYSCFSENVIPAKAGIYPSLKVKLGGTVVCAPQLKKLRRETSFSLLAEG